MPKIHQLRKKRRPSQNLSDTLGNMTKEEMKRKIIQLMSQTQSQSQKIQKLTNANNSQNNQINSQNNIINSLSIQLATSNSENLRQKKSIKNYQLALKNSKIKVELHETHEEILELYEDEQIQKDPGNQVFSKNWKNKQQNTNTVGSRLISKLDKIDGTQNKKSYKTLNKKKFSFPFCSDINENQLTKFLENIVDFINENYPKNVKLALKDYFKNGKIKENIKMITDEKGIVSTLKKDMIISLLLEKNKNELTSLSSPILCNKISEIPLNEIMIEEKGHKIKLNKDFLKKAVTTKIIKDIYEKVCEKYVNKYLNYNIDITQTLINHIDKMKIYFGELSEDICGLTIYSGDVIINAKYLNWIYSNDKDINSRKKQAFCSIFLTLLHEFSHILVRLVKSEIIKKKAKNNQFNQFEASEVQSTIRAPYSGMKNYKIKQITNIFTGKKNKIIDEFDIIIKNYNQIARKKTYSQNQKKGINESGQYFDLNFYGIELYNDLTEEEADFFLNLDNYKKNGIKNYYKELKNVYDKRDNKSKGLQFKSTNIEPYTIDFGKCNFSKRSK